MDYLYNNTISKVKHTTGVGNGVYNIGSSTLDRFNNIWARNFKGDSTASYYADLAEKYTVNPGFKIPIGTVMEVSSGEYDAEVCYTEVSNCVIGVVSENPGYIMNEGLKDSVIIGLVGTVPIKVIGSVNKKDVLVSAGHGCLRTAVNDYEKTFKVAIALESSDDRDEKLIKCFIK
jgi:hypothetical protein